MTPNQVNKRISEFLKGNSSYFDGVALFSQLSRNQSLMRTLGKGDTERNRELLAYQLGKFYDDTLEEEEEEVFFEEIREESIKPSIEKISHIQSGFSEDIKTLYRTRGHLHGQLHNARSNQERLELMRQLDKVQTAIDANHENVVKLENGIIDKKMMDLSHTADEKREMRNLRQNINRLKLQLQRQPESEYADGWKKRIKESEVKLKQIACNYH